MGRWIDERQKPTAQKPAWAESEPEEFARALPPEPPAATAKKEVPPAPAKQEARPVPANRRKKAPRGRGR